MTIRKHYRLQRTMTILLIIAGVILTGTRLFNMSSAEIAGSPWVDSPVAGSPWIDSPV